MYAMKICIVSSCGGHLTEVRALKSIYEKYGHFYVLNDKIKLPKDMEGKIYFIRHSERDWVFFVNLWEAWDILRKEQPRLILSTGAGPIVPFTILGKFFRIPTLFIETFTRVAKPSLTGRIMYCLADRLLYQWKPLARFFPKGTYGGPLV
jgi:UDP-N-acetylglucosamine:LPS N-acetylglucosamine transferase